jgi:uncharacterized protein DUF2865
MLALCSSVGRQVLLRLLRGVLISLGAIVVLSVWFGPASAEGFFSKLLDWVSPSRPAEQQVPPPTYNFGYNGRGFDYGGGYGATEWPRDLGRYRTLCVRTCDGFYFPIGDNVGRERLYTDARTCAARCDGEARLFYYPTPGGSPETMVDLTGKPYAQMPNAFVYRKTLVQGCSCKAAPWSAEATARHQGYKDEAKALAEFRGGAHTGAIETGSVKGREIEAYVQRESAGPQQTQWDGGVRRY